VTKAPAAKITKAPVIKAARAPRVTKTPAIRTAEALEASGTKRGAKRRRTAEDEIIDAGPGEPVYNV
jgi:hypothetical protein